MSEPNGPSDSAVTHRGQADRRRDSELPSAVESNVRRLEATWSIRHRSGGSHEPQLADPEQILKPLWTPP